MVGNIYVEFGGRVYQQTVGISIGTNCAPLMSILTTYPDLISDMDDYFKHGAFRNSITDVLVQAAVNATKLNLEIWTVKEKTLHIIHVTMSQHLDVTPKRCCTLALSGQNVQLPHYYYYYYIIYSYLMVQ